MTDVLIPFVLGPVLLSLAWFAVVRLWQGRVDPSIAVPWVSRARAQAHNASLMPRVLACSLLFLSAGLASRSAPGRTAWTVATVFLVSGVAVLVLALVIHLTGRPRFCLPPTCRDFPGVIRQRQRERSLKRSQGESEGRRGHGWSTRERRPGKRRR